MVIAIEDIDAWRSGILILGFVVLPLVIEAQQHIVAQERGIKFTGNLVINVEGIHALIGHVHTTTESAAIISKTGAVGVFLIGRDMHKAGFLRERPLIAEAVIELVADRFLFTLVGFPIVIAQINVSWQFAVRRILEGAFAWQRGINAGIRIVLEESL